MTLRQARPGAIGARRPVCALVSGEAFRLNSAPRLGTMWRRVMGTGEVSDFSEKKQKLLRIIRRQSLLQNRGFRLTSGRSSNFFIDLKKTMFDPEGAALLADLLFEMIKTEEVDFVGGLETGAIPLVAILCRRSWPEKPIKGFFVRKETKGHGTDRRVDGVRLLNSGSAGFPRRSRGAGWLLVDADDGGVSVERRVTPFDVDAVATDAHQRSQPAERAGM